MQVGDQFCARQAHHCAARVLSYLDSVSSPSPLFPRDSKLRSHQKSENLPRNEDLDDLRRQFALPRDRLEAGVQLIQAACFSGKYTADCLNKLQELLAVLEKGVSIKRPEQAAHLSNRARNLARCIQDEAGPVMSPLLSNSSGPGFQVVAPPDGEVVRVLLLSDLHCGMPEAMPLWPNVESLFLNDLVTTFGDSGEIDLVIFCGDMVYSGEPTQFKEFDGVLSKAWQKLTTLGSIAKNSKNPPLLTIPGNHDISWPGAEYKTRMAGVLAIDSGPQFIQQLLGNEPTDLKSVVHDALAPYRTWRMENLKYQKGESKPALLDGYAENAMLGDFSITLRKGSRRLGVVGLNSAAKHLNNLDYRRKLALDCRQLNLVCGGHPPDWARKHDACLLVTHHPTDWLDDRCKEHFVEEIYRPETFCLHIHGHMHEPNLIRGSERGTMALPHLQIPSLFGLETYTTKTSEKQEKKDRTHGYCILELTLGDSVSWFRYRTRVRAKTGQMTDAQHFDATIQSDGWSSFTSVPKRR